MLVNVGLIAASESSFTIFAKEDRIMLPLNQTYAIDVKLVGEGLPHKETHGVRHFELSLPNYANVSFNSIPDLRSRVSSKVKSTLSHIVRKP